jgi:hypothetical protein
LFIQTGQQQVLIEPGIGRDLVPGSMPGVLWDRLTEAGISRDEIDLVLFSHADIDHIGGAVAESGKAAFPHARHILLEEEAAFWFAKPIRLRPSGMEGDFLTEELCRICNSVPPERLAQLHDQLKLVSAETEVTPGIRISAAPGHTPGHAAIAMASGADRLLFTDVTHQPSSPRPFSLMEKGSRTRVGFEVPRPEGEGFRVRVLMRKVSYSLATCCTRPRILRIPTGIPRLTLPPRKPLRLASGFLRKQRANGRCCWHITCLSLDWGM